jgi:pimeloyl-ACP methyl ester carboxylesterase
VENNLTDRVIAYSGSDPSDSDAVFVHATGFCKELWLPVVNVLAADAPFRWTLIDQRGHGESTPHPGPFHWHELALDVLKLIPAESGVVGVGHSSGGAALARAEALRPGTFSRLVLIEPIILPPPYERREIRLATGAARRRRSFPSRAEAFDRFANGAFASWNPEVLDLYIDHGFIDTEDGWTLRCDPTVEAEAYREGSNVDTWGRLRDIRCPVTVVIGSESDSLVRPHAADLTARFSDAELAALDGVGHLLPMESPERVAEAIGTIR